MKEVKYFCLLQKTKNITEYFLLYSLKMYFDNFEFFFNVAYLFSENFEFFLGMTIF